MRPHHRDQSRSRSDPEAVDLDELGKLVVFGIQVLNGVTRTLTCTVIHR